MVHQLTFYLKFQNLLRLPTRSIYTSVLSDINREYTKCIILKIVIKIPYNKY